jgi:2-polyprenyl-6-hydroxyphenyl methylase / 3-demethylubiquinone-9 3-methyltransferase
MIKENISKAELKKFNRFAKDWWDKNGEMKSLHDINPLRFAYIKKHAVLKEARVLDVGCGGGLLAEKTAQAGADVTGIDADFDMVAVAKLHAFGSGLDIDYIHTSIEDLSQNHDIKYDVILCMELLEHVPDFKSVIRSCKKMLSPSGRIIFATINRNLLSFLLAIVAAEHILGMLPRGTHQYGSLIKPKELFDACEKVGLKNMDITGFSYNPVTRKYYFCKNSWVNYLACFRPV